MESALLRTRKLVANTGERQCELPIAMTRIYLESAIEKIESAAKKIVAAVSEGDTLRSQMAIVRRLVKHDPFDTIALREVVAEKIIQAGKYTLS
jgi:butyryl-CoA dehydrogenase